MVAIEERFPIPEELNHGGTAAPRTTVYRSTKLIYSNHQSKIPKGDAHAKDATVARRRCNDAIQLQGLKALAVIPILPYLQRRPVPSTFHRENLERLYRFG